DKCGRFGKRGPRKLAPGLIRVTVSNFYYGTCRLRPRVRRQRGSSMNGRGAPRRSEPSIAPRGPRRYGGAKWRRTRWQVKGVSCLGVWLTSDDKFYSRLAHAP